MNSAGASWTTLSAEDESHAENIASKLLADLTGFGDVKPAKGPATSLVLDNTGNWIIGVDGNKVQVLFAVNSEAVEALAKQAGAQSWQPVQDHIYPRWLDRFDNDALGVGALGWGVHPQDLNDGFKWLGEKRLNIESGELGSFSARMVAPGLLDTALLDYYAAIAEKYHLAFMVYDRGAHPIRPEYLWNIVPRPHYLPDSPDTVSHPTFGREDLAGYAEFAPCSTDAQTEAADAAFAAEEAKYPYCNALLGTPELGHNHVLLLPGVAGTPEVKAEWEAFLQERMKDLKTAGTLYQGNPDAYPSWDAIPLTTMKTFAGWEPATCFDLRKGDWEAKSDQALEGETNQWFSVNTPPDGWVPLGINDPIILVYANDANPGNFWEKTTFSLDSNAIENLKYLHISRNAWHGLVSPPPDVYVNGQKATLLNSAPTHPLTTDYDLCYEMTNLLQAGDNLLVLNTHGYPVANYIFLGNKGLWSYPSDNPELNRMYFDMVEFASRLVAKQVDTWLKPLRAADPAGRPIMVAGATDMLDMLFDLSKKYGAYVHNTGATGDSWSPYATRYLATRGLPTSSEPGGAPPDALHMQKMITLFELLGDDADNLLNDPTMYNGKPDVSNWIDSNAELLKCLGKTDEPPPDFCVLRSIRDASRLRFKAPWAWDISRGEAQSVGRCVDLVDTSDLLKEEQVEQWCHVLFDTGTELMTDEEISGLEKYISNGGTFVAIHETGMHSPDRANSWPISQLTGLKVVSTSHGKIQFADNETLWPSLRGKVIDSDGLALDWKGNDLTGPSIGMEAKSPDVEVIAEWVDKNPGEGKIAIAVRHIGKGQIIMLGSSFWRNSEDIDGSWKSEAHYRPYLAELLDSLNVPADSQRPPNVADSSDVFAEHFLSKNGIYDLYFMAKVNDKAQPSQATVTYTADHPISWLKEISAPSHPDVPFQNVPAGFTLSDVNLDAMQLRIFAAPRSDIASSTMSWLQSLHKRWYALDPLPASDIPAKIEIPPSIIPMVENWTMVVGGDAWKDQPPEDASYWASGRTVKLGTFVTMGVDEQAVVHFQKVIHVPKEWENRRIVLTFAAQYALGGIKYKSSLWVKSDSSDFVSYPVDAWPQGAFTMELTNAKPDSDLTFDLEVNGSSNPNEKRFRPSGVLGVFFLEALPVPIKTDPLSDWMACVDINNLSPVSPSQEARFVYLETKFKLPDNWPAKRLFLESSTYLGWVFLNGHVVSTPGWMNRLDISNMVKTDGSENVLRWCPAETEYPTLKRILDKVVPPLNLAWYQE